MSDPKQDHIENSEKYKGLKVNKGIDQPEIVNPASVNQFLKKRSGYGVPKNM